MVTIPQNGGGIAWANFDPSQQIPVTPYDTLLVPDGRTVGVVPNGELQTILDGLGIAGISASNGRVANLAIYSAYLSSVSATAGAAAVTSYLASKA